MPVMPGAGHWPPSFPSTEQGWFTISERDPDTQQFVVSGPYLCTRVPMNGQLQMPAGKGNQIVVIDERLKLPLETDLSARSVVTDIETNVQYEVIQSNRWTDFIEAYLVRRAAD